MVAAGAVGGICRLAWAAALRLRRIVCGLLFATIISIWALTVTSFGDPQLAGATPYWA
jgi:hypothetical protein